MTSQYPSGWDNNGSQFPSPPGPEYPNQPYPQPGYAPAQRSNALPMVLIGLVVGALLVLGAALGAVLWGKSKSKNAAPAPTVITSVVPNPESGGTTTVTETVTPSAPADQQDSDTVAGTDSQGFTGNPARCNVDDPAVFIGRTERSSVVICRAGATGGLYYIGYAGGHRSPDVSWPEQNGSTYVFRSGGTSYVVSPSSLTIQTPSESVVEPWLQKWGG
ncbi:hypothetical protein [Gordonia sp. (in: high G+C Gram-positive bacteria)]|uniref:hypothetical protein n=1 Tax=Gordonia sp. (in: high G+C Gram-positive bacteria) TaxID=84139 RepID=UPI0039E2BA61